MFHRNGKSIGGAVILLLLLGFGNHLMMAATQSNVPAGQSVLPVNLLESFTVSGRQAELAQTKIVDVTGQQFSKALQIETMPGAKMEYSVSVSAPVTLAVKRGDVLLAHFWLRCADSMTGEGYTTFCFQENRPPNFEKAAQFSISSGKEWKEVFIPFTAPMNFPAGEAGISFWVGYDRQTIEIGGMEVINYQSNVKIEDLPQTKVTYVGREPDAPWRKEALARIERIRKGDLDVYVTNSHGMPMPDATVHAVQVRHAFGFGTCVAADLLLGDSPDAERYRRTVLSLFNLAVFENEMKWQATWDGVPPSVDKALAWLRSNGIVVRGHNLVWPSWQWLPRQLRQYQNDPAKLREITAAHITDMVSHFRGQLVDWDVVNEPFTNHDLIDLLGGRQVMVDWYKLAHQADPNCRLFLNDFGILDGGRFNEHRENFYDNIQYLIQNGAPLGGIGIQSHFGTELPAPADVIQIMNRFGKFGLPIESTELSLNLHDRQLQADYLRDYMIALFSQPQVKDIILWGFWQKRHWRPEAGIFADDWTPRPAAQVWIDLTQKQWHTDVTLPTSPGGEATVRGFFGTYAVTVTSGAKSKTVAAEILPGGSRLQITLE